MAELREEGAGVLGGTAWRRKETVKGRPHYQQTRPAVALGLWGLPLWTAPVELWISECP